MTKRSTNFTGRKPMKAGHILDLMSWVGMSQAEQRAALAPPVNLLDSLLSTLAEARTTDGLQKRLLIERAQCLCEQYSDSGAVCQCGCPFDAHGHCPACLERAELMTEARESCGRTALEIDPVVGF